MISCHVLTKGLPNISSYSIISSAAKNCLFKSCSRLISVVGSTESLTDVHLENNEPRRKARSVQVCRARTSICLASEKASQQASELCLWKSHVSGCSSQTAPCVGTDSGERTRGSFVSQPSASAFVSVTSAGEAGADQTMWTEARSKPKQRREEPFQPPTLAVGTAPFVQSRWHGFQSSKDQFLGLSEKRANSAILTQTGSLKTEERFGM